MWTAPLWAFGLLGCSDDGNKPAKIRKVEGVAEKIDLKGNYVAMSFTDDKGVKRTLAGTVKEDTEVWINGRSHRLEDVREGDKVVVFGYREGSGAEQKLVATKIQVSRPEESDWKSSPAPAADSHKPGAAASTE